MIHALLKGKFVVLSFSWWKSQFSGENMNVHVHGDEIKPRGRSLSAGRNLPDCFYFIGNIFI